MFEEGLAELHTHLGGSVSSDIMWTLAHEQGIALPVKDYWEFDRLVTVSDPRGVPNLDALDAIYHWTELIRMMDRTVTAEQNPVLVEKAIAWAPRGVVGVDIAGPRPGGARYDYTQVVPMIETAREAGLGVTIHVGEEGGEMGREELGEVV